MERASYSKWTCGAWRAFKKAGIKTPDVFIDTWQHVCVPYALSEIRKGAPSQLDPMCRVADLDIDFAWCDTAMQAHCIWLWKWNVMRHYFIEEGVAEFCMHSVRNHSQAYWGCIPDAGHVGSPHKDWPVRAAAANDAPNTMCDPGEVLTRKSPGAVAFHFPTTEHRRSIMVMQNVLVLSPVKLGNTRASILNVAATDGYSAAYHHFSSSYDCSPDKEAKEMLDVVYGLSLYMDAFPEAVVESSDMIKHISHYRGGAQSVTRNNIAEAEGRASVSPHWRRGHFRLLSSSKYTEKRGQTVFVRGTFVKGKAFDVLDDA